MHDRTVASDISDLEEPVPDVPYYLDVRVKVVALDLNKAAVGFQLECVPKGADLVDTEGHLWNPVTPTLGVSVAGSAQKKTIPADEPGAIITIDLDLEGNVAEYPWDRHKTSLWLSAVRRAKGLEPEPVPTRLQAYGAWPGLVMDASTLTKDWSGDSWNAPRQLDLRVNRSTVTAIVVCFSIVLTWSSSPAWSAWSARWGSGGAGRRSA